jgi:hypothetical protein
MNDSMNPLLFFVIFLVFVGWLATHPPISSPAYSEQKGDLHTLTDSIQSVKMLYESNKDIYSLLHYETLLRTLDSVVTYRIDSLNTAPFTDAYMSFAKQLAKQDSLDWSILYAIWQKESALYPHAKGDGSRGVFRAFGTGQAHLSTARLYYNPTVTERQLLDPIIGAQASAAILRACLQKTGNYKYAISAYQQGITAALRDQREHRLSNPEYVLEVMDFALNLKLRQK